MADINFDFITDDQFRASLESDYYELTTALETGLWKSVYVLAGSVVEAILIDYLLDINYKPRNEILVMDLNKAITACRTAGVLSERVEHLSHVIRDYRNLIHAGRVLRLKETVDEDGAATAQRLVRMIVREITEVRKQTYGYTAEQIVAKLEADPSVGSALLENMLNDVKPAEKRRLLLTVLPRRYFDLAEELESPQEVSGLEKGFRIAFDSAPDDLKRDVVAKFISMLKEEGEHQISLYERAFFRASDLEYCSLEDAKLVKEHVFVVLSKHDWRSSPITVGLGKYLNEKDEVTKFIDALVTMLQHAPDAQEQGVANRLYEEWLESWLLSDPHLSAVAMGRVNDWINLFETYEDYRYRLAQLLRKTMGIKREPVSASDAGNTDISDDDIPF